MRIIEDFVKSGESQYGYGYFEDDLRAVARAKAMTRSQRKNWRREKTVPVNFLIYLRDDLGVIDFNEKEILNRIGEGRTLDNLPLILRKLCRSDAASKETVEYLSNLIHQERYPMPEQVQWRYRKPHVRDNFESKERRYRSAN